MPGRKGEKMFQSALSLSDRRLYWAVDLRETLSMRRSSCAMPYKAVSNAIVSKLSVLLANPSSLHYFSVDWERKVAVLARPNENIYLFDDSSVGGSAFTRQTTCLPPSQKQSRAAHTPQWNTRCCINRQRKLETSTNIYLGTSLSLLWFCYKPTTSIYTWCTYTSSDIINLQNARVVCYFF